MEAVFSMRTFPSIRFINKEHGTKSTRQRFAYTGDSEGVQFLIYNCTLPSYLANLFL